MKIRKYIKYMFFEMMENELFCGSVFFGGLAGIIATIIFITGSICKIFKPAGSIYAMGGGCLVTIIILLGVAVILYGIVKFIRTAHRNAVVRALKENK